MTVYVTRYALRRGILKFDNAELSDFDMAKVTWPGSGYGQYFHKGDWHLTLESAQADAKLRRMRKIASLRKAIAKLEGLIF